MQTEFVIGSRGALFTLMFPSSGEAKGHILFCPGFGEEMNRSRHVVANQARRFADHGYNCLLVDHFGTGDSQGELSEASWSTWCADIAVIYKWLQEKYGELETVLWGMRLGCLLAANVVSADSSISNKLLFWQPVTDGNKYITQMLRQRIAHLVERGLPKQSTQQMREALYGGDSIEIGGYQVSGQFAMELESQKMGDSVHFSNCEVYWLQQENVSGAALPIASKKIVDALGGIGNNVSVITFNSAPIWQLHERVVVEDLHAKTSALELL